MRKQIYTPTNVKCEMETTQCGEQKLDKIGKLKLNFEHIRIIEKSISSNFNFLTKYNRIEYEMIAYPLFLKYIERVITENKT